MSDEENLEVVVVDDLTASSPVNDLPEAIPSSLTHNEQDASTSERKPVRRGKLVSKTLSFI